MGNAMKNKYVNFEFLAKNDICLINTFPVDDQDCLIKGTVLADKETELINSFLSNGSFEKLIVVYGKNHHDVTVTAKHEQLVKLGFHNAFMYSGGLFEWLLLQDVYGASEFPTTKGEDLLKYKY